MAVTGYRYSAVEKAIWLAPKVRCDNPRMFFSTGTAWGTIVFQEKPDGAVLVEIEPALGAFELNTLYIDGRAQSVATGGSAKGTEWSCL